MLAEKREEKESDKVPHFTVPMEDGHAVLPSPSFLPPSGIWTCVLTCPAVSQAYRSRTQTAGLTLLVQYLNHHTVGWPQMFFILWCRQVLGS